MNLKNQYRLRVQNCIGTIIDVHKSISHPYYEGMELVSQFEKLKKAINNVDMNKVSERDVRMVEQVTNDLLYEFRPIFETGDCSAVYGELKH